VKARVAAAAPGCSICVLVVQWVEGEECQPFGDLQLCEPPVLQRQGAPCTCWLSLLKYYLSTVGRQSMRSSCMLFMFLDVLANMWLEPVGALMCVCMCVFAVGVCLSLVRVPPVT